MAPDVMALAGQSMWRAAERRAATLYRRAFDGADVGDQEAMEPAVELALARAGGGQPLPEALRHEMERELGVSLRSVRIHADSIAAEAARVVHAKAFTVGEDIFFGDGEYAPESAAGQKLLAHELAHVAQAYQGRTAAGRGGIQVSDPGESLEREADVVAERISARLGAPRVGFDAHEESQRGASNPTLGEAVRSTPELSPATRLGTTSASTALLLRKPEPAKPLAGKPVRKNGIVYKKSGVNLWEKPNGKFLKWLPFNAHVFVDSAQNGWSFITTNDGRFGYCLASSLKTDPPEPNAKIHWVKTGDTALKISQRYYGGQAKWGSDHRFYVNGLVHVNKGPGNRGIYKPKADAAWDTTKVRADYMIWVPSLDFMKSLRGKISSGSITNDAWNTTKVAAEAVGNFLLGVGSFIAGVLHGALESLWDVLVGLKDLAVMIWDVLKSLVTGNLLSDAMGLWNNLSNLDWGELVRGWISDFDAKWNSEDIFTCWHFRGWVIGYAVMEVLMLIFSGGILNGAKWVAKSAKVAKILKTLPRVEKLAKVIKADKAYGKISKELKKGADVIEDVAEAPGDSPPLGNKVLQKAAGMVFTRPQLQHAFKHASDFGVSGNMNNVTLDAFKAAIEKHVVAPGTRPIAGEYRGMKGVTHFVDPKTGLNVIRDSELNFLSGWKLSAQQLNHVLTSGKLGGG